MYVNNTAQDDQNTWETASRLSLVSERIGGVTKSNQEPLITFDYHFHSFLAGCL